MYSFVYVPFGLCPSIRQLYIWICSKPIPRGNQFLDHLGQITNFVGLYFKFDWGVPNIKENCDRLIATIRHWKVPVRMKLQNVGEELFWRASPGTHSSCFRCSVLPSLYVQFKVTLSSLLARILGKRFGICREVSAPALILLISRYTLCAGLCLHTQGYFVGVI